METKKLLLITFCLATITGCSLLGIHFRIHNPKHAGKYPKETEALKLFGDQTSRFRTCVDVKYYLLNVRFGKDLQKEKEISGRVYITSIATRDFDTLQLDLSKEMEAGPIRMVDHAFKSDDDFFGANSFHNLKSERKGATILVCMDSTIRSGQTFTMMIPFSGTPIEAKRPPWDGGFVRKQDDLKNPWWGVACETEGASLWFPCKDVVNDEADSTDLSYTVSNNLKAIGNGTLERVDKIAGDMDVYHWHISYPINLYDVTFYIGNFKLLHDIYVSPVTHDTLQLNHYVLEQHYDKAKKQFEQLKDYLAFYEQTFGLYPWYRDGFKLVESPYEGMEHQSAIAYGNGFHNDPRYAFDYIILHETAHEWWGNAVTAEDLGDGWIHEGFATYTEALWVEHKFGKKAYSDYLLQNRLLIINRRPVSHPYNIRYFDYHDEDIYMKGAWVLHSLRYVIGDSAFFKVLKKFYGDHAYKNATSKDLIECVNSVCGGDCSWYMNQYLYNRFVPELNYYYGDDGYFYFKWDERTTGPNFRNMPILVNDRPGTKFENKYITANDWPWKVERISYTGGDITLDESLFLFKAVENKKLQKEYLGL